MKKVYDFVVGVGSKCGCSIALRAANLQIRSYPFDWLTAATFETRFDLILNDFANFMDFEDMELLPDDGNALNDRNCDYYLNKRNQFRFIHDFLKTVPFEESFKKVKEKYERRIERFYQDIKKHKKVLLVWMDINGDIPVETLKDLHQKTEAKFGKKIDFLIVEPTLEGQEPKWVEVCEGVIQCKDKVVADIDGFITYDVKRCRELLAGYRHRYSFDYIWNIFLRRRVFKHPLRLLALLIPVTAWRKKIKRIYKK